MDVLADLDARGLIHDTTDREALAARLAAGPVTLYYGCDPTADSLHIGNLIGLLVLRRFADAGHRPIALAGGATGMVGDPGGRSSERNLLDEATLRANAAAIKEQITRVLGDPDAYELVDNLDWTRDLTLLEFLREVGKHVTVNQMMARESVKARLASEHGISFTEFSYMLLQGNDYRILYESRGCELQIGGSDQWGNIVQGVDLIRRTNGAAVHALSWPLLLAPDGTKLGKTAGASVWLSGERTSAYEFFQHWMRADDRQVGELLAKFTLLPMAEVAAVTAEHEAAPEERQGQRRLAHEVTSLVHGTEAAAAAAGASGVLFGEVAPRAASADALGAVAANVPAHELALSALEAGIDPVELAVVAELAASKSEARRLLAQRGVSLNGRVLEADDRPSTADLLHGRYLLLRRGKATWRMVVAISPAPS
ncbi:MAG: tyrosine--tRNA ligase [Acidimicrobiia bacterium]|nr:tyrosine--tRNA ligase [Acidimicrobiia bacterium]